LQVRRLPRKNLGILSRGGVQCQRHHVSPRINLVELGVDHQLSGSWHSYGKQLPGNDRWLQSPAFGQVGGIPSIPLQRLRRFCLYGVGDLVQWLREPMPCNKSIVAPSQRAIPRAGFELFFNVMVYPFLLFGTQTLEIRERSCR
jgi:hypothetical protein